MKNRWWNPFAVERVTLHAPHPPEACASILEANIHRYWTMADNALPFIGSARRDRFTLFKNTPYIRNGFKPAACGRITSDGAGGATIRLRLMPHIIVRVWLALALLVCGGVFVGMLVAPGIVKPGTPTAVALLAALLTALIPTAAICGVYLLAAWLARNDRVYLTATLARLLDAISVTE